MKIRIKSKNIFLILISMFIIIYFLITLSLQESTVYGIDNDNETVLSDFSDVTFEDSLVKLGYSVPANDAIDATTRTIVDLEGTNKGAKLMFHSWSSRSQQINFSSSFTPTENTILKMKVFFHISAISPFVSHGFLGFSGVDETGETSCGYRLDNNIEQDIWIDLYFKGETLNALKDINGNIGGIVVSSEFRAVNDNEAYYGGWGGYIAFLALSKEKRFAFGSISYTSAYLYEDDFWHKHGLCEKLMGDNYKKWIDKLDPKNYIKKIKAPVLLIRGANDSAFSIKSWSKTLKLIKAEVYLSVYHTMVHDQLNGSISPEIFKFAESIVNKNRYYKFIKEKIKNGLIIAKTDLNIKINKAELIFTVSNDIDDHNWVWEKQKTEILDNEVSSKINESFTAFYILITTKDNLKFSSKIYYQGKI